MSQKNPFVLAALFSLGVALPALAQAAASITTPDKVDSRLGTLEFEDGAPNAASVAKIYDNLD
jgi:hypothetical protein